ncbi:MAG: hypothetical protein CMP14_10780 [Rickettsiales bacterium]|nr:hypothetical protein [Rickettsiales bacterium]
MNVTTFYSFKGGVGRTLALANVAYELARTGARVLVVDFDLEAPGLDSIFSPPEDTVTKGLVEYIDSYLEKRQPDDVRDFVYEWAPPERLDGSVNVMPAGKVDKSYSRRLGKIDWVELYDKQKGYMLFEDLKRQWNDRLGADYVLIDSRTGHSDVVGICTRQLPDSVVVLFIPNTQNISGIKEIATDIKSEHEHTKREKIDLIYVASNLPNLDDEKEIISTRLEDLSKSLEIDTSDIYKVHRYESLELLTQPLFVEARPQTRISKEFKGLTQKLRLFNLDDKEGVRQWLRGGMSRQPEWDDWDELIKKLKKVESKHSNDPQILYALGKTWLDMDLADEAVPVIQQAIECAGDDLRLSSAYLGLTRAFLGTREYEKAADAARKVLETPATPRDLRRVISLDRMVLRSKGGILPNLIGSSALNSLPPQSKYSVATYLDNTKLERTTAFDIVESLCDRANGTEDWYRDALFEFGRAGIAVGKHEQAVTRLKEALDLSEGAGDTLALMFNLTMARWGQEKEPDEQALEGLIARIEDAPGIYYGPNFEQCAALVYHLAGRKEDATRSLLDAYKSLKKQSGRHFSCWSYLSVSNTEFLDHLGSMKLWMSADPAARSRHGLSQAPGPSWL